MTVNTVSYPQERVNWHCSFSWQDKITGPGGSKHLRCFPVPRAAVQYDSYLVQTHGSRMKTTYVEEAQAHDFIIRSINSGSALVKHSKNISISACSERSINSYLRSINPVFLDHLPKFGIDRAGLEKKAQLRTFVIRESWLPLGAEVEVFGFAKAPDPSHVTDADVIFDSSSDEEETIVVLPGQKPQEGALTSLMVMLVLMLGSGGAAVATFLHFLSTR